MKRFFTLFLVAAILLVPVACNLGSAQSDANDPNLGVYVATTAEYSGFTISIDEILDEGGMEIELKPNGKCNISISGRGVGGKWELTGTDIAIKGGGVEWEGTLIDGNLRLVYGDDVVFNLTKNTESEPSASAASPSLLRY